MMADRYGRITNVIICEDIRREPNNRNTLVGVYSGDILVSAFPASLPIAIYAEYVIDWPAEHEVQIRVTYGNDVRDTTVKAGMRIPASVENGVALALPPKDVLLPEKGTLVVEASFGDGEWIEIASKAVEESGSLQPPAG